MFDILVVGLGQTGLSIVRFCKRTQQTCAAWEPDPLARTQTFHTAFPDVELLQGDVLPDFAYDIPLWVLSPGIPLNHPEVLKAQKRGIVVTGDVTLFAERNTKPVLAVTGSNGKSTVVSLLEKMVAAVGLRPALLGNIGVPVLDGLDDPYDLVILELSSFQLDITEGLNPLVGCILNITPDHLDRHGDMATYTAAKQRIYLGASHAVCNADDPATFPDSTDYVCFSMKTMDPSVWHLDKAKGMLRYQDKQYPVSRLPIHSEIHYANVLAALAIMQQAGFDTDKAFAAACEFEGLPHRLVLVGDAAGVKWYDDSKATNVGATLASIDSVAKLVSGRIVIILGGLAKGASFECLRQPLEAVGRTAILIGAAQDQLDTELKDSITCVHAPSLKEAVALAKTHAEPGDAVLLAPACASWDMFKHYADRGEQFTQRVREILSSCTQTKE